MNKWHCADAMIKMGFGKDGKSLFDNGHLNQLYVTAIHHLFYPKP